MWILSPAPAWGCKKAAADVGREGGRPAGTTSKFAKTASRTLYVNIKPESGYAGYVAKITALGGDP